MGTKIVNKTFVNKLAFPTNVKEPNMNVLADNVARKPLMLDCCIRTPVSTCLLPLSS